MCVDAASLEDAAVALALFGDSSDDDEMDDQSADDTPTALGAALAGTAFPGLTEADDARGPTASCAPPDKLKQDLSTDDSAEEVLQEPSASGKPTAVATAIMAPAIKPDLVSDASGTPRNLCPSALCSRSCPAIRPDVDLASPPPTLPQPSTTPRSTPKPRQRCVLVAKCLTNSDASSGRIILPRVAVEANLPFVTAHRHYALAVRDATGRRYEFVIKSWANGTEHRRVFVLEQASDYLRAHGIGVGDTVGICTDEHGELVVEANTPEVCHAVVCPKYGAAALAPPSASASGLAVTAAPLPLAGTAAGRCARSVHCSKAAGHAGFCSGPKAAAAAAAAAVTATASGSKHLARIDYGSDSGASDPRVAPADECSSDETAATTMELLPPAARAAHSHRLPADLHPLAHLPAGLRVCKELTAYDLSSRRAILPADDIDAGVPNAGHADLLSVAAVDESQGWQFLTLRAWHSVTGRRGYALEDAGGFLANRGAMPGDELVVYRLSEVTPPRVEVRVGGGGGGAPLQLRQPACPDASLTYVQLPLLLLPEARARAGPAPSASAGGAMVCHRTGGCTKAAGHQGFCSGHKGFKRKDGGTPNSAAGSSRGPFRSRHGVPRVAQQRCAARYEHDDLEWASDEDRDYEPISGKRHRRAVSTPRGADPLLSLLSLLDG